MVDATGPQARDFFNPLFEILPPIPQIAQDHGYRSGPVLMFAGRHQIPKFALKFTGNRTGEDDDVASLDVGIILQCEARRDAISFSISSAMRGVLGVSVKWT